MIKMTEKAFISEHKDLVRTLRKDNPKMIKRELKEQGSELKKVLAKNK